MGSPSRNVQYHPPRLSEDRLNLAVLITTLLVNLGIRIESLRADMREAGAGDDNVTDGRATQAGPRPVRSRCVRSRRA